MGRAGGRGVGEMLLRCAGVGSWREVGGWRGGGLGGARHAGRGGVRMEAGERHAERGGTRRSRHIGWCVLPRVVGVGRGGGRSGGTDVGEELLDLGEEVGVGEVVGFGEVLLGRCVDSPLRRRCRSRAASVLLATSPAGAGEGAEGVGGSEVFGVPGWAEGLVEVGQAHEEVAGLAGGLAVSAGVLAGV